MAQEKSSCAWIVFVCIPLLSVLCIKTITFMQYDCNAMQCTTNASSQKVQMNMTIESKANQNFPCPIHNNSYRQAPNEDTAHAHNKTRDQYCPIRAGWLLGMDNNSNFT